MRDDQIDRDGDKRYPGEPSNPDLPARRSGCLLLRLQTEHPGEYPDTNLRTLQRRVKLWRRAAARKLVFTKDVIDAAGCSAVEIAS